MNMKRMKKNMKRKKYCLLAFFILVTIVLSGGIIHGSEVSVDAATTQTGFVRKNGSWYYYDKNGKLAKGWYQTKSGTRYYFGKTGAAKSGILTVNGKKYCFTAKGKMLIAWQTIDNKTYFFDLTNGYMHTGWLTTPAGNKYYFWNDGVIRSGFHRVKNVFYCFNKKGKMLKNCFQKNGPSTYYLKSDGTLAKGRMKIKNTWYSFNRNTGRLV